MASHPVYQPFMPNLPTPRNNSIAELIGKEWENALNRTKSMNEPRRFEEEMLASEMLRKYQGSQAAHADVLTRKARAEEPYWGQMTQAEIAKAQAEAIQKQAQAQETQALLRALGLTGMGAGGFGGAPEQQQSMGAMSQEGFPMSPMGAQTNINQSMQNGMQGLTPAQQNWLSKKAFGSLPKQMDVGNGQVATYNPFTGQYDVQQVGPTAGQIEESKETAKYDVAADEEARKKIQSALESRPIFDELLDIVNDPNFYKATGKLNDILAQFTNNKEVNDLAGRLQYLLGQRVNVASRQFGSRLTNKEYSSLEKIKGSKADNPYNLRSKVLLMDAFDRYDLDVNRKYLENRKNKMDRDSALEKAHEDADYREIKALVAQDDMIRKIANKNKLQPIEVMEAAEEIVRQSGGTIEDALRDMQQ